MIINDPRAALAQRILARRRLIACAQMLYPTYQAGWVHQDIAQRLERFYEQVKLQQSPRLMLNMPPRLGKSMLASTIFPAWLMGQDPRLNIILTSYNIDLPLGFSRKIRRFIRDDEYYHALFPDTNLSPDSQSAEAWSTTQDGSFFAAGIGGPLTGRGADILLIDDYIKNIEEADNQQLHDKHLDWYQSCFVAGTPVRMANGTWKAVETITPGEWVASFDESTGRMTTNPVVAVGQQPVGPTYTIRTRYSEVRCSGEHPFWVLPVTRAGRWMGITRGEWRQAKDIKRDDFVLMDLTRRKRVGFYGAKVLEVSRAEDAVTYNLEVKDTGTFVADGFVVHNTAYTRLAPGGGVIIIACMTGDTPVLRPDGTSTPLAEIRPGDRVVTYDNGQVAVRRVLNHQSSGIDYVYAIRTTSGIVVRANARHPFLVYTPEGLRWKRVRELKPQDLLVRLPHSAPSFIPDSIASITPCGRDEVFDMQIEGTENFIANGLVSHNTRWSFADLSGQLQQLAEADPEADRFEVVDYAAVAESYEYRDRATHHMVRSPEPLPVSDLGLELLRRPGEVLHPERFSEAMVRRIRANLSPRVWSALYQQKPAPDEGLFFKKEYIKRLADMPYPNTANIFTAWDFAITTKTHNDYTSYATMVYDASGMVFIPMIGRFKRDTYGIVAAIVNHAEQVQRTYPHLAHVMGFEDGQIFKAIEPVLRTEMQKRRVFFSYEVLSPTTDKMVRARPLQAIMQQGIVYFAGDIPLMGDVEEELLQFPAGRHDDFVDALSWAARMVVAKPPPVLQRTPPIASWKDKLKTLTHVGGSRNFMGV